MGEWRKENKRNNNTWKIILESKSMVFLARHIGYSNLFSAKSKFFYHHFFVTIHDESFKIHVITIKRKNFINILQKNGYFLKKFVILMKFRWKEKSLAINVIKFQSKFHSSIYLVGLFGETNKQRNKERLVKHQAIGTKLFERY